MTSIGSSFQPLLRRVNQTSHIDISKSLKLYLLQKFWQPIRQWGPQRRLPCLPTMSVQARLSPDVVSFAIRSYATKTKEPKKPPKKDSQTKSKLKSKSRSKSKSKTEAQAEIIPDTVEETESTVEDPPRQGYDRVYDDMIDCLYEYLGYDNMQLVFWPFSIRRPEFIRILISPEIMVALDEFLQYKIPDQHHLLPAKCVIRLLSTKLEATDCYYSVFGGPYEPVSDINNAFVTAVYFRDVWSPYPFPIREEDFFSTTKCDVEEATNGMSKDDSVEEIPISKLVEPLAILLTGYSGIPADEKMGKKDLQMRVQSLREELDDWENHRFLRLLYSATESNIQKRYEITADQLGWRDIFKYR